MPSKSTSEKITVKITLFPPFSKKTSKERINIALEENSTVRDLLEFLVRKDDHLKKHLGDMTQEEDVRLHALITHNDHLARLDKIIQDGDRFNLLQPLQGG